MTDDKTYMVYKATYQGYVYYGFTTSLSKRRKAHIHQFSLKTFNSTSNYSVDMLTETAKRIDVNPKLWDYEIVVSGLSKSDALRYKAWLVRSDKKSINYVYKHTHDKRVTKE